MLSETQKNQNLEIALQKIDKKLKKYSVFLPADARSIVRQNALICLWKFVLKRYDDDWSVDSIYKFCDKYLKFAVIFSHKTYNNDKYSYLSKNLNIDDHIQDLYYHDMNEEQIFSIDFSKYEGILLKNEIKLLQILFENDIDLTNLDKIGRQLGYSGRGIIKYHLQKIAEKLQNANFSLN